MCWFDCTKTVGKGSTVVVLPLVSLTIDQIVSLRAVELVSLLPVVYGRLLACNKTLYFRDYCVNLCTSKLQFLWRVVVVHMASLVYKDAFIYVWLSFGLALYQGLRLTPVFVACSTNVEEGLVKLSHVQ